MDLSDRPTDPDPGAPHDVRGDDDTCRPLSREDLHQGGRRAEYIRKLLGADMWSEARLQASLDAMLRDMPRGDVWIFAYGSLIWNPLFPVAEERVARIHGFHRSFCIWSRIGRGSPERPGLVLGLDRGGNCRGVALRLEERHVRDELSLIWRREMITGAYRPTWVRASTAEGLVDAIAFVADRKAVSYAGDLTEDRVIDILSHGGGFLGTCSEYLAQTTAGLAARGIHDEGLARLARGCGCKS